MSNRTAWQTIIFGPLGGLLPIIVSLLGALFGSNIGQVLPWFTLITFPIGLLVALVGVAGLLRNSTKSAVAGGTNSKVGVVRFYFSLCFVLILANTAFRLFVLYQGGGILYIFELMPLTFSLWLAIQSWKLARNGGATFQQFFRAQVIVSAVMIVGGIPAMLSFELLVKAGEEEVGSMINVGSAITSMVPVVTSLLSLIFMLWVKRFQHQSSRLD